MTQEVDKYLESHDSVVFKKAREAHKLIHRLAPELSARLLPNDGGVGYGTIGQGLGIKMVMKADMAIVYLSPKLVKKYGDVIKKYGRADSEGLTVEILKDMSSDKLKSILHEACDCGWD